MAATANFVINYNENTNTHTFTDTSTGSPLSAWAWNFGDSTTSSLQNPPGHVYSGAPLDAFVVVLTVTGGSNKQRAVRIPGTGFPQAYFTWSPEPQVTGSNVTFTNTSVGTPSFYSSWVYAWDFGDGATSSSTSPTHSYSTPGTYTVTLSLAVGTYTHAMHDPPTSQERLDATAEATTFVISHDITIIAPVVALFDWTGAGHNSSDYRLVTDAPITFTDGSTGTPTSWAWTFGDGGTSTSQYPSHTYAAGGIYTVGLTASKTGSSSSVSHTIYIADVLVIDDLTLPDICNFSTYPTQTITFSGGVAPFSVVSNAFPLPTGMSFNDTTLELSGTPNIVRTDLGVEQEPFTLRVSIISADSQSAQKDFPFNIKLSPVLHATAAINGTDLPDGQLSNAYSTNQIYVDSGIGAAMIDTWVVTSGVLPNGITLVPNTLSDALLAGTPTEIGYFTFTVTATAQNGCQGSKSYQLNLYDGVAPRARRALSIEVYGEPTWVTTSPIPSGNISVPYSTFFVATDAVAYGFNSGSVPPGLNVDVGTGEFFGTPTVAGVYVFEMAAVNSTGCLSFRTFQMTVGAAPPDLTGTFTNVCNRVAYYNNSIAPVGGLAPFSYAITGGFLPDGLTFNTISGTIGGVPSTPGVYNFDVTITDANALSGTQSFGFTVYNSPTIEVPAAPPAIYGKVYAYTFTATGGTKPFTWTVDTLPPGLTFNAYGGSINGTPTVPGFFEPTVTVTDANGCSDTRKIGLTIFGPPIINELPLPPACQNQDYSNYIVVSGGNSPYYWFITSDTFPPQNLVLNPYTGQLLGIPLVPGAYPFTVKVVDQNTLYATKNYTLIVRTEEECGQPDEGETITVTKVRLSSMESQPVVVEDPFHQKHLYEYLPVPFSIKNE